MSRAPSDIEPRAEARFSASQRFNILLRQSDVGADDIRRAFCDECAEPISELGADDLWQRLRPICFDHALARGLYGKTTTANGRAVCDHPRGCHKIKSAAEAAACAKSDRMGMRSGQQARRAARRAAGKPPLIRSRGFEASK